MNSVQSVTDQTEALKAGLEKLALELTSAALSGLPPQSFYALRDALAELHLLYRKMERRADYQHHFEALASFAASIREPKPFDELAFLVTSQIVHALGASGAAIILRDVVTGESIVMQAQGSCPFATSQRFAAGSGLIGQVIATKKPYITAEHGPQTSNLAYTNAAMALPLITPSQLIGVLWLARNLEFSESEIALVRVIADVTANALHSAKLTILQTDHDTKLLDINSRLKELADIKAKFINDMSHELRTPVTGLNMILYLLERNGEEKYGQYLSNMREDVERLTNLSESIFDIMQLETRLSNARFEQLDFNALVIQLVDIYKIHAQSANISWTFEAVDTPLFVKGDQSLLIKAVGNLLTNAVSYAMKGNVKVSTARDTQRKCATLIVENSGIGIDPADLPHLFERFYRGSHVAESSIPGAGLGLAVVKEIVDLHQGRIEVERTAEEKTRFTMYLPLTITEIPA